MFDFDQKAASKQLSQMTSSITDMGIRSIIWYSNKFMRIGLGGLHVNEKSINRVK